MQKRSRPLHERTDALPPPTPSGHPWLSSPLPRPRSALPTRRVVGAFCGSSAESPSAISSCGPRARSVSWPCRHWVGEGRRRGRGHVRSGASTTSNRGPHGRLAWSGNLARRLRRRWRASARPPSVDLRAEDLSAAQLAERGQGRPERRTPADPRRGDARRRAGGAVHRRLSSGPVFVHCALASAVRDDGGCHPVQATRSRRRGGLGELAVGPSFIEQIDHGQPCSAEGRAAAARGGGGQRLVERTVADVVVAANRGTLSTG